MPTSTLPAELAEWAGIYDAMAARGFGQADVDEMELWVIAEVLGVNAEAAAAVTGTVTVEQHRATSAELIRRRMEAAARGEKLEAPAVAGPGGLVVTDDMRRVMAERKAERRAARGSG